jgi:hypothetical protein
MKNGFSSPQALSTTGPNGSPTAQSAGSTRNSQNAAMPPIGIEPPLQRSPLRFATLSRGVARARRSRAGGAASQEKYPRPPRSVAPNSSDAHWSDRAGPTPAGVRELSLGSKTPGKGRMSSATPEGSVEKRSGGGGTGVSPVLVRREPGSNRSRRRQAPTVPDARSSTIRQTPDGSVEKRSGGGSTGVSPVLVRREPGSDRSRRRQAPTVPDAQFSTIQQTPDGSKTLARGRRPLESAAQNHDPGGVAEQAGEPI